MRTRSSDVLSWIESGRLPPTAGERAVRLAGLLPDGADWRVFVDRLLLWAGALLLAAAAMLTVLGFANGNRVLLGLGMFGLIAFVSNFYYRLDATLLDKSAYLAAGGALLLMAHQGFVRVFGTAKVRHA